MFVRVDCRRRQGKFQRPAKVGAVSKRRGVYRHHPLALKRSIVEETLKPGAWVARIARQHSINANQVFLWRKAYQEGLLPESTPTLLPVTIVPSMIPHQRSEPAPGGPAHTGCLTLEIGHARIRIEGRPDAETLRLVLTELRQR